ncbi:MAG: threonine--tRNA ligase [Alphaproteobacteria bacterium GM202ARS2]|nr:threonine--tRNA ligase [Alphaproteobacteria bacterium GM202ARS2]
MCSQDLQTIRHSAAHLMATAVQNLFPSAKFGIGPPIEEGFYYDIEVEPTLTAEDLPKIEKEMKRLAKQNTPFEIETVAIQDAIARMQASNQPYKVELLKLLRDKGTTTFEKETNDVTFPDQNVEKEGASEVTFYRNGNFVDLCRGPHVKNTGAIQHFKLTNLAGAYWRGDVTRPQLQRLYGTAFKSRDALKQHLADLEERKKRDHRRLGTDLDLFHFSPSVGSGLPIWLPKGNILRQEIEFLAKEYEHREDYQRVTTPILAKEDMYHRSGHLPYYSEDMYSPIEIENTRFYLRPMNCPHHHEVYLARPRSYRDLPFRIAEYGDVFRYEASGGLSGLMRTRGFCQNDAHIYCAFDQAEEEFLKVMHLHATFYKLMGIERFYMRLSLPDMTRLDKYVNQPDAWIEALRIIKSAMDKSGLDYVEAEGEAAFYGPKVDFMIRSITGVEYAISTNQLDFLATQRFNLNYTGPDGTEQPVYVIHRAPLGSHERFVAFLIEHFGGAFPTWLAPVQVQIVPIADRHIEHAKALCRQLKGTRVCSGTGYIRAETDASGERMQKKIRLAETQKIPYVLVIGDKEIEAGTVSVRTRGGHGQRTQLVTDFIAGLVAEISERRLDLSA